MAVLAKSNGVRADAVAVGLVILGNSRIQQVATLHGASPLGSVSICLRTASTLKSRTALR